MRIEFMSDAVPPQLFTIEDKTIDVTDPYTATQLPQLVLVIIPRTICLDITLDMEVLVELLHEDTLVKGPACRILDGIDIPALGNDAILDDARVGNQRVDTIAHHHRC